MSAPVDVMAPESTATEVAGSTGGGRSDEELLALLDDRVAATDGKRLTRQEVMETTGTGTGRATRLLAALADRHGWPTGPVKRRGSGTAKRSGARTSRARKPAPAADRSAETSGTGTGQATGTGAATAPSTGTDSNAGTEARTASGTGTSPGKGHRSGKSVPVWPVILLALPAFVAIWGGWVGLGEMTGFGPIVLLPGIADGWTINSAITLPIGVETYAAYALNVWLSGSVPPRAQRFAKWSAIGSLLFGALGQVAYHLMEAAGMDKAPWLITTLVSCLPVVVLGCGAALAHLIRHNGEDH